MDVPRPKPTARVRPCFATGLLAGLLMLTGTAGAQSSGPAPIELPEIGSPADSALTLADEHQIGLMVVRGLRDQGQILDDPETHDYLQSLGMRIASQAPEANRRFQFFVVRDPRINAFALPGGFIGVNQGLILATANEAQLAGVLAHEIAHVTQRHIARSIRAQGRQGLASAAAILAAILLGAVTGSPDAAQAGIVIAQGAAAQQQINFTRANEYEADRVGIGLLAAAGFDPNGMPDFFETLSRRSGLADQQVPEFLRTHPVTRDRVAESRERAQQFPRTVQRETPSYALVRERVRVLGGRTGSDLRPYYEARRQSAGPLTDGQRYGEALALLQAGQAQQALGQFMELAGQRESSPMLQASLGQALFAAGRVEEAKLAFERALAVSPRNLPLSIRYAEVLMNSDRAREAHQLLLDLFNNVAPSPEQIRLIAMAASGAGDTGDAYYYMSEYHISSGDLPLAAKQLELALASPNLTSVQKARFGARLKEIRDFLAESGRRRGRDAEDAATIR